MATGDDASTRPMSHEEKRAVMVNQHDFAVDSSRTINIAAGSSMDLLEAELAATIVSDAFKGRFSHGKASLHDSGEWLNALYDLQTSSNWLSLLLVVMTAHACVVFLEPPQIWADRDAPAQAHVHVVELFCLAVYATDIWLKMTYFGRKDYLKNSWQRYLFYLTILTSVDTVLALVWGSGYVQPTRVLRPVFFLLRQRDLRKIFTAVTKMSNVIFAEFARIATFLLLFAAVGVHLFGGVYTEGGPSAAGPVDYDAFKTFDSVARALPRLFVLLTTENYANLYPPAYQSNPAVAMVYFVTFQLGGVILLVSLLFAVVVDFYWKFHTKEITGDRKKMRKSLVRAYNLLDPAGTGQVNLATFAKLHGYLTEEAPSGSSNPEVKMRFKILDTDSKGYLDPVDFLNVRGALNFHVRRKFKHTVIGDAKSFGDWFWAHVVHPFYDAGQHKAAKNHLVTMVTTLNAALLVLVTADMPPDAAFYLALAHVALGAVPFVDFLLYFLRAETSNRHPEKQSSILWELFVTGAAYAATVAHAAGAMPWEWSWLGPVLMLYRLNRVSKKMKTFLTLLHAILPGIVCMLIIILITMYCFAVFGVGAFGNVPAGEIPFYAPFDTFPHAMQTMFHMLVSADWHALMDHCANESGHPAGAVAFFVGFNLIVQFVLMNLLVAILTNTYFLMRDNLAEKRHSRSIPVDAGVGGAEESSEWQVKQRRGNWREELVKEDIRQMDEMEVLSLDKLAHCDFEKIHTEKELGAKASAEAMAAMVHDFAFAMTSGAFRPESAAKGRWRHAVALTKKSKSKATKHWGKTRRFLGALFLGGRRKGAGAKAVVRVVPAPQPGIAVVPGG